MTSRREFLAGAVLGGSVGSFGTYALISSDTGGEVPVGGGDETPTTTSSNGTTTEAPDPPDGVPGAVMNGTNEERQSVYGGIVPDLHHRDVLSEMAAYHSRHMAGAGAVGHSGPGGETLLDRYRKYGIAKSIRNEEVMAMVESGGENVAAVEYEGLGADELASSVLEMWNGDEASREVLLFRQWREHGVGVAAGADGRLYVTQTYL